MGDRARRRTRQPHSAARLLQGVAAGRQPSRSGRGAALRRQRVPGRAHDPGRGGKDLLRDLARQVGHHGVLRGGLRRRRDRLRGAAAPERVVRRHLPRRAADPGRRSRDRRPARHDLVSRNGARRPAGRRVVLPALSRGEAGVLRRRRARRGRARAGNPGEAKGRRVELDLGRLQDAGPRARRAARSLA